MHTKLWALTFTILGLSLLVPLPAMALVVNCQGTVNLNGGTEVMENDLSCNTAPALTVNGPGTFDMAGHKITCTDNTKDGLVVGGDEATVQTGVVQGCRNGVTVNGNKHTIEQMVSKDNDFAGFLNNAPKSKFRHNTATNNQPNGTGFENDDASSNSTFEHNTASGNTFDGFRNGAEKTKFRFNTATNNGERGFRNFSTGNNSTFQYNTASNNTNYGFRISGQKVKVQNNTATANGDAGIRNTDMDNTYKKNLALGNANNDLEDAFNDCDNNVWTQNTFGTKDPACIQ